MRGGTQRHSVTHPAEKREGKEGTYRSFERALASFRETGREGKARRSPIVKMVGKGCEGDWEYKTPKVSSHLLTAFICARVCVQCSSFVHSGTGTCEADCEENGKNWPTFPLGVLHMGSSPLDGENEHNLSEFFF